MKEHKYLKMCNIEMASPCLCLTESATNYTVKPPRPILGLRPANERQRCSPGPNSAIQANAAKLFRHQCECLSWFPVLLKKQNPRWLSIGPPQAEGWITHSNPDSWVICLRPSDCFSIAPNPICRKGMCGHARVWTHLNFVYKHVQHWVIAACALNTSTSSMKNKYFTI